MQRMTILTYCPGGERQQSYWDGWARMLAQQNGRVEPFLECFQWREEWVRALSDREREAGLLGAACTVEDIQENGSDWDIQFLDNLVQRGFPVLMFSRGTLQEKPGNLPELCDRQWRLLFEQFGHRF